MSREAVGPPTDLADLDLSIPPLRRHWWGGTFSHHGSVVFRPSQAVSSSAANISIHELSHFWLHASTPYGQVLNEMAELQAEDAVRYCQTLFDAGARVPIPAYDVARILARTPALLGPAALDAVERFAKPWSRVMFLEHLFEGYDNGPVRTTGLHKVLVWLAEYETRSRARTRNRGLFTNGVEPSTDYQAALLSYWAEHAEKYDLVACAKLRSTEGAWQPLGAMHLFEAHAQYVENYDAAFGQFLQSSEAFPYYITFSVVMARYGYTRIDSSAAFDTVLATFALLVDLALYVPLGSVYSRLREDQMFWPDLHPGHRFERLLDAIDDDDWVDGIDERAPLIQRRLSQRLGWPHPDRFLERGASLKHGRKDHARHAAACRVRLESPDRRILWHGGDVTLFMPDFLSRHAPMQVIDGVTCVVPGDTVDEMLDHVIPYAINQLSWMAMATGAVDFETLVPPGLVASRVFANVKSSDDFLNLIGGVLPFIDHNVFYRVARSASG
jgi:hypothetical protein